MNTQTEVLRRVHAILVTVACLHHSKGIQTVRAHNRYGLVNHYNVKTHQVGHVADDKGQLSVAVQCGSSKVGWHLTQRDVC